MDKFKIIIVEDVPLELKGTEGILKNDVPEDKYESEANAYGAHTIFSDNNNMIFKTFTETTDGLKTTWNTKYYSRY